MAQRTDQIDQLWPPVVHDTPDAKALCRSHQGEAITIFAVEILWRSPLCVHGRPSVPTTKRSEEGARETVKRPYESVYSFGAAQAKFAASLCSPFPEKCATAG
jgi:hypothetical protein